METVKSKLEYLKKHWLSDSDEISQAWCVRYLKKLDYMFDFENNKTFDDHLKVLSDLEEENKQLFLNHQIPIIVFSTLELVHKAINLCAEYGEWILFFHLTAHLLDAATPKNGKYSFGLTELPEKYLLDLKYHPDISNDTLFYKFLDFAYSRYKNDLNRLLYDSDSTELWIQNIINCRSSMLSYVLLPVDLLKQIEVKNYLEYKENDKIMAESVANLFVVITDLSTKNIDKYFSDIRRKINTILINEGKLKAMMKLNVLHKNKLEIPTFIFNQIKNKIAQEKSVDNIKGE